MAKFSVSIVTTIEVGATIEVTANDEELVYETIQAMTDAGEFSLTWDPPKKSKIEFEELEQNTKIEACDKQE